MIRKWWRNWGLVDLFALGLGLAMCIGFLWVRREKGTWNAIVELWPNMASEVVGAWISVRIIDGLISRREQRTRLRDGLVNSFNFALGVCQDLPPMFHEWRVNDFTNELILLRERLDARQWQLRNHCSPNERQQVEAVYTLLKDIQVLSDEGNAKTIAVEEAEEIMPALHRHRDVRELISAYHRFLHSGGKRKEKILKELNDVWEGIAAHRYTTEEYADAKQLAESIHVWMDHLAVVNARVAELEIQVKKFRHDIVAGA